MKRKIVRSIVQIAVVLGILYGANETYLYLMDTKPKAKKRQFERAIFVQTKLLVQTDYTTQVAAMGKVVPSQQVEVIPQVGGKIMEVGRAFAPGGFFAKGEIILRIDPVEESRRVAKAELALAVSKSELEKAREEYEFAAQKLLVDQKKARTTVKSSQTQFLEAKAKATRQEQLIVGNLTSREVYDEAKTDAIEKAMAYENSKLLLEELETEKISVALKKRDIELAEMQVDLNQVLLEEAQQDLEYTTIRAPFDALLLEKHVSVGSTVTTNTRIASLVDVSEYWVEVSLPVDRLPWLEIPRNLEEGGSLAKIYNLSWPDGVFREGYIKKLKPSLEDAGRMAQVVFAVPRPFSKKDKSKDPYPLLLGSFVRLEIAGKSIPQAFAIPRSSIHNHQFVWLFEQGKLKEQRLQIVWTDRDFVYVIEDLQVGDKLVVSDVPGFVAGMEVQEIKRSRNNTEIENE